MNTAWTRHLTSEKEKADFEQKVISAAPVLDRLYQIIVEDAEAMMTCEESEKDFDVPNWDFRQAFRNGYKSVSRRILVYLTLDQRNQ